MKVLKTKDSLKTLIESKTKEISTLEQELADLKLALSEQERSEISFKLVERLKKFEDLISDLRSHISDFNKLRRRIIFELTVDEENISILDIESGKKVSNIFLRGANDFAIREWLKDQFNLIDFYHDVVSDYRKYLVDSTRNRVTLKFSDSLTFHLVKYGSDVKINVHRKLTKLDVINELITRSRTPHEDRKYESDFWELNDEEFILLEESTFDRPAATVDREIEDILELFS